MRKYSSSTAVVQEAAHDFPERERLHMLGIVMCQICSRIKVQAIGVSCGALSGT